ILQHPSRQTKRPKEREKKKGSLPRAWSKALTARPWTCPLPCSWTATHPGNRAARPLFLRLSRPWQWLCTGRYSLPWTGEDSAPYCRHAPPAGSRWRGSVVANQHRPKEHQSTHLLDVDHDLLRDHDAAKELLGAVLLQLSELLDAGRRTHGAQLVPVFK